VSTEELTLEKLQSEASVCNRCNLAATRNLVAFGEGNSRAELMLVGEAPGENEDKTGKPFVGAAGRILNKVLDEVGIQREDIYITGVVKCRPPKNRLPHKAERNACMPFLEQQIQIIKPRIIICLGSLAANTLIDPKAKITEVRGKWFEKNGIKLIPTYHPAAVFHDQAKLDTIREDFQSVKKAFLSMQ
jgi:uracil-DNA glycosylase family 4